MSAWDPTLIQTIHTLALAGTHYYPGLETLQDKRRKESEIYAKRVLQTPL